MLPSMARQFPVWCFYPRSPSRVYGGGRLLDCHARGELTRADPGQAKESASRELRVAARIERIVDDLKVALNGARFSPLAGMHVGDIRPNSGG